MATTTLPAGGRSTGMSLGGLLGDALRSPLAQAFVLAVAFGTFLFTVSPHFGWRDTYRGAPLGFGDAPSFALTDQGGEPVALADLAGGPVVLTFLYTNCQTACPMTTAKVERAVHMLGTDAQTVRVVGITVDPARDGPAELRAYAEQYKLQAPWRLLTGAPDTVQQVVEAYHAQPIAAAALADTHGDHGHDSHAAPGAASDEIVHPTMVVLIDAQGLLRFAFDPNFVADDLAHDIQLLQRDMGGPSVPFPLY